MHENNDGIESIHIGWTLIPTTIEVDSQWHHYKEDNRYIDKSDFGEGHFAGGGRERIGK